MELLARTGMRCGELTAMDADAMVRIGQAHWLRIPLGKLRNDRYVPLYPQLGHLLATWTATYLDHIRAHRRALPAVGLRRTGHRLRRGAAPVVV